VVPARVRNDRRGAEETFQALPALLITIVVVGLVFGAVGSAHAGARSHEQERRAHLQADLFVEGLSREPWLQAPGGAVGWQRAEAVASGAVNLSFVPPRACAATLVDTASGLEIFLFGSAASVTPGCVWSARPVAILLPDGSVVPGILRAGVLPP
jgi:hypothetical protein